MLYGTQQIFRLYAVRFHLPAPPYVRTRPPLSFLDLTCVAMVSILFPFFRTFPPFKHWQDLREPLMPTDSPPHLALSFHVAPSAFRGIYDYMMAWLFRGLLIFSVLPLCRPFKKVTFLCLLSNRVDTFRCTIYLLRVKPLFFEVFVPALLLCPVGRNSDFFLPPR